MQPSLEKLRKFFRLEHENGYSNSAIIGGLEKILDFWESEARLDSLNENVIQDVAANLRSYAGFDSAGRADSLKDLWKRIGESYPEALQKTAPRPRPISSERETTRPAQGPRQRDRSERRPRQAPAPRASVAPGARHSQTPAALDAPLTVLQGVGPKHAATLESLGMQTLGDMLYYFPRRYEDYSQLKPIKSLWYGEQVTVIGTIQSVSTRPIRRGAASIVEAVLGDGTGSMRLSWFNNPWMANRLKEGMQVSVSGKVNQYLGKLVMNQPDWEPVEIEHLHTNRIVPVYSLTTTITQKWLRNQMNQVVTYWAPAVVDALPDPLRESAKLPRLGQALLQIHFPDTQEQLNAAQQRLAFDEIFFLQMGVLRQKRDWQQSEARRFSKDDDWVAQRTTSLPFELTQAQKRTLTELRTDLDAGKPMNRLLQGDVGSGKTVLAVLAAAIIASHGSQTAILAPTSILAEQHYRTFQDLLVEKLGVLQPGQICLLIGATPEAEKETLRNKLADGTIKVVIGTHAILEDPVRFADLQLAVIDEQHRFGVAQRAQLRSKGGTPHLLVMTATPIPRSLALTLYGDLDISVLDEMPSGRQPVTTHVLTPQERERAFTLIRGQIKEGRQAFIIYPLIDESEKMENLPAAVDEYEILSKEVFPDLKLGLLHGRLKAEEKEEGMLKFRDRAYDILVSTTVVEVGVDVPNATVMLIEGADRFGLATLHQLRGRVGRGAEQSTCLLIPSHEDAAENERLQAMVETNDGFVLAERDLKQRGPGEFLGTRQAGFASSLRMASLTDLSLIEKARLSAQKLFAEDADLVKPDHALLKESLNKYWGNGKGDVS